MVRVNERSLAVFCRQLASLLKAGIPLTSALITMRQFSKRSLGSALTETLERLEEGCSLYEAVSFSSDVFPPLFLQMMRVAEITGTLDEGLERLAVHFEKEAEIKDRLKTALTYPLVLLSATLLSVCFLFWYVIPTFAQVYRGLEVELPLLTRVVLTTGTFISNYWYWLGTALLMLFVITLLFSARKGRAWWDRFKLVIPAFGKLNKKIAVVRFCRTLGILLRSGFSLVPALEIVQETIGNEFIAERLGQAGDRIRTGQGVADSLEDYDLFPPLVLQMVRLGEETGALDVLLEKAAVFYEEENKYFIDQLTRLVEPVLIIVIGFFVGIIVISLFMPIFNLYSIF